MVSGGRGVATLWARAPSLSPAALLPSASLSWAFLIFVSAREALPFIRALLTGGRIVVNILSLGRVTVAVTLRYMCVM